MLSGSVRIARISGISVEIHLTFLLTLLWAAWQGSRMLGGLFGAAYGILAILLLFTCVFLHELGHSLQAKMLGVEVERITLLPIGGMARMESMHDRPTREFLITLAGPGVNLALAAGLVVALTALGQPIANLRQLMFMMGTGQPSLQSMLTFLLGTNLLLFAFNMLPAFPMDGGRILRALLALVIDYGTATWLATSLGRVMAVVLMVFGLIGWPPAGIRTNPLLIFIGLVVFAGASEEVIFTRRRAALSRIAVRQVANSRNHTLSPNDPITPGMTQHAALPVVVGTRLIGLVTAKELRDSVRMPSPTYVAHVMRTDFPVLGLGESLWTALEILQSHKLEAAPVVDDGALHGMVSLRDIHRALRQSSVGRSRR